MTAVLEAPSMNWFGRRDPVDPSYWDQRTLEEKVLCQHGMQLKSTTRPGGKYAKLPSGCIKAYWEKEVLKVLENISKEPKHQARDVNTPRVTFHLYLLSVERNSQDAIPNIVVLCQSRSEAQRMIDIVKKHPSFLQLNLGIEFLIHSANLPSGRAGDAKAAVRVTTGPFDPLTGQRFVTCRFPREKYPSWREGTIGGVITLDQRYYAIIVRHVFYDEDEGAEKEAPPSEERSQEQISVGQDERRPSVPVHEGDDDSSFNIRGVFLYSQGLVSSPGQYGASVLGLDAGAPTGNLNLVGYIELDDETDTVEASALISGQSKYVCRDSDWALVELRNTLFMQPNSVRTAVGQILTLDSIYLNSSPPEGPAIVAAGISGITATTCLGHAAGMSFPWSSRIQKTYLIDFDCAKGDSGAWVVNPDTGCIYGMIVAASEDFTYVLAAEEILESITSRWPNTVTKPNDIFPERPSNRILHDLIRGTASSPNIPPVKLQRAATVTVQEEPPAKVRFDRSMRSLASNSTRATSPYAPSVFSSHEHPQYEPMHPMPWTPYSIDENWHGRQERRETLSVRSYPVGRRELSPLALQFSNITPTDYLGSMSFIDKNSNILHAVSVSDVFTEAARAQAAGHEQRAFACVHQCLLLRKRLDDGRHAFELFVNDMTLDDYETQDHWWTGVETTYNHLKLALETQSPDSIKLPEKDLSMSSTGAPSVRGSPGDEEISDPSYRKREKPEQFFCPGRVFEMLWRPGPSPLRPASRDSSTQEVVDPSKEQEEIPMFPRRMVVVQTGQGYSSCLPINTYGGKGVLKKGFTEEDQEAHAIIHMETSDVQKLSRLPDVAYMTKRPILVTRKFDDRQLDDMSRINFRSREHTVAWDVKVKDLGKVVESSMEDLLRYWYEYAAPGMRS